MTISHLLPKSSEMQVFDERFGPTQHGRDNSEDIQHRYLLPRVEPSILAARGVRDERLVGLEVDLTTAPRVHPACASRRRDAGMRRYARRPQRICWKYPSRAA